MSDSGMFWVPVKSLTSLESLFVLDVSMSKSADSFGCSSDITCHRNVSISLSLYKILVMILIAIIQSDTPLLLQYLEHPSFTLRS